MSAQSPEQIAELVLGKLQGGQFGRTRLRELIVDGIEADREQREPVAEPRGWWIYAAVIGEPGEKLELGTGGTSWHAEDFTSAEDAAEGWPLSTRIVRARKSELVWEDVPVSAYEEGPRPGGVKGHAPRNGNS